MTFDQIVTYSLPLIGAFNGWFTTYLAIRMLFRPRRRVKLWRWTYQAPLPKRQTEIAERIGEIVEAELISYADIQEQVVTPAFLKRVGKAIEAQIGEMLADRRASLPSIVQKLLTDDLLRRAAKLLSREVADHLPELSQQMFDLLSQNVSIRKLIAQKVAAFELQRLEEVVFQLASRELRLIELFCGLLGFLIGCIQLAMYLL
jgi:uncharacterized membrane protein YheB (UPF0754 family)